MHTVEVTTVLTVALPEIGAEVDSHASAAAATVVSPGPGQEDGGWYMKRMMWKVKQLDKQFGSGAHLDPFAVLEKPPPLRSPATYQRRLHITNDYRTDGNDFCGTPGTFKNKSFESRPDPSYRRLNCTSDGPRKCFQFFCCQKLGVAKVGPFFRVRDGD